MADEVKDGDDGKNKSEDDKQDETAAAVVGDTGAGKEGGGGVGGDATGDDDQEEEEDQRTDRVDGADVGPEKEAAGARPTDEEGGAAATPASASGGADAASPPSAEIAATDSDAKGIALAGTAIVEPTGTNAVEPTGTNAVETATAGAGTEASFVGTLEDGRENKERDDPDTSAAMESTSGPVDGSDVAASVQTVHDTALAPAQAPAPAPAPDTAGMVATVDHDIAAQKPVTSGVEGTQDAEMAQIVDQTNPTDITTPESRHLPSSLPDEYLSMEVEEEPLVEKSEIDGAGRKRNLHNEDDAESPEHKRQRVESDEAPPIPASSTETSSRVITQDAADTTAAMPQPVQSPGAQSSHTPTAHPAIDQVSANQSPQDESDEIRKVLEPTLSASSGSPNASSQPPTPLFESRPRSMSISPPSDPNHSRLCSPVHFTMQEPHEVAAQEEKKEKVESVEYTPGPCLETIKMNLYLEGRKAHRGNGPERQFADYWDALARNIALGLRGKDKSKRWSNDEACNGIEYSLNSFLITKQLKRLHNELILAIMKQSLATLVEENKFRRHIPIAWRGKARKKIGFPQKPSSMVTGKRDGDVEAAPQEDTETSLEEDLKLDVADSKRFKSIFAYDSTVWSTLGQRRTATDSSAAYEISHIEKCSPLRSVIPSANLPGALIIDPLVRSSVKKQNMKVSEDAIWLATTAVRDYATTILRNAVQNKIGVRGGSASAAVCLAPLQV